MTDDPIDPHAALAIAERQELTRLCAVRVLRNHANGVPVAPETLQWARAIDRQIRPLGRPLTSGDYGQ